MGEVNRNILRLVDPYAEILANQRNRIFLSLKNNRSTAQTIRLFDLTDDPNDNKYYDFTLSYAVSYASGTTFSFDANGTTYTYTTSGTETPTQVASGLTALGQGTWTATSSIANGNVFSITSYTVVYSNFNQGISVNIPYNYGNLYNWYAIDTGLLAPIGYWIPSNVELATLITTLGGDLIAGGKLKSLRTEPTADPKWKTPNTGASNLVAFNLLPSGLRIHTGIFTAKDNYAYLWARTEYNAQSGYALAVGYNDASLSQNFGAFKASGHGLRFMRNATILEQAMADGTYLEDVLYNGDWYKMVKIGTQVWSNQNLKTTKYNDGTPIPEITDDTAWQNDVIGAYCTYNNVPLSTYEDPTYYYSISSSSSATATLSTDSVVSVTGAQDYRAFLYSIIQKQYDLCFMALTSNLGLISDVNAVRVLRTHDGIVDNTPMDIEVDKYAKQGNSVCYYTGSPKLSLTGLQYLDITIPARDTLQIHGYYTSYEVAPEVDNKNYLGEQEAMDGTLKGDACKQIKDVKQVVAQRKKIKKEIGRKHYISFKIGIFTHKIEAGSKFIKKTK